MNHPNSLSHHVGREFKSRQFKGAGDDGDDIASLAGALATRDSEIKKFTEGANARLMDIEQKLARRGGDDSPVYGHASGIKAALGKLSDNEALQGMAGGAGATTTGRIELGLGIKALTSLQGSPATPASGIDVPAQFIGNAMPAQRPLSLLEALPSRPVASNRVEFFQFGGAPAADYQEGEGTEKAEADVGASLQTANIATIAVHQTVSKQLLGDMAGLQATIGQMLSYDVVQKAERELLQGDGTKFHIDGLLTGAGAHTPSAGLTPVDRVGEAVAAMEAQGFRPDLVVVNPADWFAIASAKSAGSGEYLGGGPFGATGQTVWNRRVVANPIVPAGTVAVLDTAWLVVLDREQPTVMVSSEHGSNFTANLVTILVEARLGLAVMNPAAVLTVDLTTE